MKKRHYHIVIAGGGIGGLCAAISLKNQGHDVTLFEASPCNRTTGAGILQPQNAQHVLKEIGVLNDCCSLGYQTTWLEIFDEAGELIEKVNEKFIDDTLPGRNNMLRAKLNNILTKHAETAGVNIRWGMKVVSYKETASTVTVFCKNGKDFTCDLLVGFDGIHSAVRDAMLEKKTEKEYLGVGAFRFYIEFPENTFSESAMIYKTGEFQVGVIPLSVKAGYVFILKAFPADYQDDERTRFTRVKEMLSHRKELEFITTHISKKHPVIFNKIEQIRLTDKWYKGRVVIGGDAAHAGAPTLAQGAAMAIEDAIVLADELGHHQTIKTALQAYYERRAPRASKIQELSANIIQHEMNGNPNAAHENIANCYSLLKKAY
ncbi:FAD-dependent monooxygenase [Bacillus changyiensis]|uniref:FAD-dependent monooxygenase n=1 Tax=Bacillus changyiensis TaxID=3004103 RepID=UPI0022E56B58|nr:FAD-dependent monooxygenase [Bacillus changyiensis]MDA1477640.1 FAD-dependent monooxygenase [Bacillus changyiensis]